jgi:tetratricopeptide (TPR) repeat protein
MSRRTPGNTLKTVWSLAARIGATVSLSVFCNTASCDEVRDLKYGAVLFEFYQQKYFETLVEFEYASERGGISNHGDYPELLKGGVSLSYGLDRQARTIFSDLIAANAKEETRNRAWFYLAKMLYLRGDVSESAVTLSSIHGTMPRDVDQEYRYLAALVNIKLGYFDAAEDISASFDKDGPYAPYLYFNLGVAYGKQKQYERANKNLLKAASYAGGSDQLARLADRARMAMAYLYADHRDFTDAYAQIKYVSASGVFSNRALLGSGWASVNSEAYQEALAPLSVLEKRSMAIPEVQEAVLLLPHVYEKLGLEGRAAEGFIKAYASYGDELERLERAREVLKDADVLELFVRNLDEMLGESDWFGTAPSVSLNPLSPYLLDLMSDHSFQSVLKELRDLYAIRNNLNSWKRKRNDFRVILEARSVAQRTAGDSSEIANYSEQQASLRERGNDLARRAETLGAEDRQRVDWLLSDLRKEIDDAGHIIAQLQGARAVTMDTNGYRKRVDRNMQVLDKELANTNKLVKKVESVLLELVSAELDIHEERMKYYRIQAHLAKARILDRSLGNLDVPEKREDSGSSPENPSTVDSTRHGKSGQGGDDAG